MELRHGFVPVDDGQIGNTGYNPLVPRYFFEMQSVTSSGVSESVPPGSSRFYL